MRRILTTAADSLHEMGHIVALLALFIYIFALVGMKLFSTNFWFEEGGVSASWEKVNNEELRNHSYSNHRMLAKPGWSSAQ